MTKFGDALHGQSANAALIKLAEMEIKMLEKMKIYVKKRGKIDQEYAKQVFSVNEEYGMKNFLPGMESTATTKTMQVWLSMAEGMGKVFNDYGNKAATTSAIISERLDVMISRKKQAISRYLSSRRILEESCTQHTDAIEQQRQRFQSRLRDCTVIHQSLKEMCARNKTNSKKYDLTKERYIKTAKALFGQCNDFYISQISSQEHQLGYEEYALPALLNSVEDTHLMYTDEMKEIFKDMIAALTFNCDDMRTFKDSVDKCIDTISMENEFSRFLEINKDEKPSPNRLIMDSSMAIVIPGLKLNSLSINTFNYDSILEKKDSLSERINILEEDLEKQTESLLQLQSEIKGISYWNDDNRINVDYIGKHDESLLISCDIGKLRCELGNLKVQQKELNQALDKVGDTVDAFEEMIPFPSHSSKTSRKEVKSTSSDIAVNPKSLGKKLKKIFWSSDGKNRCSNSPSAEYEEQEPYSVDGSEDSFNSDSFETASDDTCSSGLVYENLNVPLEEEPYFFGELKRPDAEKLLDCDGDYLIRVSIKPAEGGAVSKKLVLTTKHNGRATHFIIREEHGYYKFDDKGFGTVQELLHHYRVNGIPLLSTSTATIVNPVVREIHPENMQLKHNDITCSKKLGEGCFGEVMLGTLKRNGTMVAVKQCKGSLDEYLKDRFLLEAAILKQYNHPHIVRLIGICADEEPVYIVMEYMDGGDFHSYLRQKNKDRSPQLLLKMMCHAASGMAYLESKKCIHRDLAARNCLLTSNYTLKISDFGMAREGDDEDVYLVTDKTKKMPLKWTAPEAIHYGRFTTQSDVWSFGILLWETFSFAQMPYPNMNNRQALQYVDDGNRLTEPKGTPPNVYQVMLDCWQQKPEDRPTFAALYERMVKLSR